MYGPYVVWPAAAVVGFIGYNLEWAIRGEQDTQARKSIEIERMERKLGESAAIDPTQVESLKSQSQTRSEVHLYPNKKSWVKINLFNYRSSVNKYIVYGIHVWLTYMM